MIRRTGTFGRRGGTPVHWRLVAASIVALPLWTGCATFPLLQPPRPTSDDIIAMYHYHAAEPWIHDEEKRVRGLLVRVYFVPAGGEKGVFVPGVIRAGLYELRRRPDGTYDRSLAYEWVFNEQQARGFRIIKPSNLGESYGFVLRWPNELELAGKETELRFSYERKDGRVITGRGTSLARIPGAGNRMSSESSTAPAGTRPAPGAMRAAPAGPQSQSTAGESPAGRAGQKERR